MAPPRILLYLLRRDLRLGDNPVFHDILRSSAQSHHPYTHLLPLYVFAAQQIETSGFLNASSSEEGARPPYPEARSQIGHYWRCGPHRAKFVAESVFDLKTRLENAGGGLEIRAGMLGDVVNDLLEAFGRDKEHGEITGVCMTGEAGVEERREEADVRAVAEKHGKDFRLWQDEKNFIDDRDVPCKIKDLPDLFTTYRNKVEPLRDAPRRSLSVEGKLPPMPSNIPPPTIPLQVPNSLDKTISALLKPLEARPDLKQPIKQPEGAKTAIPFTGGETTAHERVRHLISGGHMTTYKDTRNGMLGADFSTKLSSWLALGSITSRQIHEYLLDFEDGRTDLGKGARGYGKGENKGTGWVRFELLWRDYMRLLTRKYTSRLFRLEGFQNDTRYHWKYPQRDPGARHQLERFLQGQTGQGLIDASMRELVCTGYTSNRTRQNVGSFLARHLELDWRFGAEWYESWLVDYDVSSNWGNWQYVSLTDRMFNPVKQGFDYDPEGTYVRTWVSELHDVADPECIYQPWKLPDAERQRLGLTGNEMVEDPLKRIQYRAGGGGREGGGKGRGGYQGRGRGKNRQR